GPVQLPFTALEDATGRRRKGGIGPRVDLGAHLVHRLGDRLGVVPGEILGHGVADECTARFLQPACETLGIREEGIGDGNRGLHTRSITGATVHRQPSRSAAASRPPGTKAITASLACRASCPSMKRVTKKPAIRTSPSTRMRQPRPCDLARLQAGMSQAAGRNLGSVISVVTPSNTTSSRMPVRGAPGPQRPPLL